MRSDDIRVKKLVKKLAKNIDICRIFGDIVVVNDPDMPSIAGVNPKNNTLFINIGNKFFTFGELLSCIEGVIVHEAGHNDFRLGCPHNFETFNLHKKMIKNLGEKGMVWLNIVYDFEIHYQYNKRGYIKPKYQRKLKQFLTLARNKVFKKSPNDIILSMEYPDTKEQKMVKRVIEDRNLTVIEKVKKLAKSRKLNPPKQSKTVMSKNGKLKYPSKTPITEMLESKNNNKNKTKALSIINDIENKRKENHIRKKLSRFGLSLAEIDAVLKRYSGKELVKNIKALDNVMTNILPNMEHEASIEKTKKKSKDRGSRINGYKRMTDVTDVTKNVEDFVTVGEYDLNEVRIPYKIDRKCKGNVVIVRDVSGSVSVEPVATIVRDVTVSLIQLAKKKQHKVCVLDFHSEVEPIRDSKNNLLTSEYNLLLFDSMQLKQGYTTRLNKAIEFINENIVKDNIPLNVFIVSDGFTGKTDCLIKGNKINLVGIIVSEVDDEKMISGFEKTIQANKGKIYMIRNNNEKELISKLAKDFSR